MCDIALNLASGYLIEGVIIADIMANYDLFIERVKDIHKTVSYTHLTLPTIAEV